MKKILFTFFLLIIIKSNILAFDNSIKLYDYAQVLNNNEEEKIKSELNKFINQTNSDIVIVSVKYYGFNNVEEYANEFYNKNQFKNDGVILIIDLKDKPKYFIKGFGKLNEKFTPGVIDKINSELKDESKYYNVCMSFIKSANEVNDIKASIEFNITKKNSLKYLFYYVIISLIIPSIIISIIYILSYKKLNKLNQDDSIVKFSKENNIKIISKKDEYISTNTSSKSIKERI